MGNSQQLFQSLFKKDLSANDSKDFLIKLTKEYPFFTAAHFFLLKHQVSTGADYSKEAAITSLLFNNALWLNFQLDHTFADEIAPHHVSEYHKIHKQVLEEVVIRQPAKTDAGKEFESVTGKEKTAATTIPIIEIAANNTTISDRENAPLILSEEEKIPAITDPAIEVAAETIPNNDKENFPLILLEEEKIVAKTEPILEVVAEAIATSVKETVDLILPGEEKISVEEQPIIEVVVEASAINKEEGSPIGLPKFVFNKEEENGMDNFTEEDFENEVDEVEIEPMNIKLDFTNINTTEDTIAFEPLHVSDYFTSVGIKLADEVKPGDKLGKQLKSFTQWLKTMKKVHIEQLQDESAENNDHIIQQMAEKSNKEGETLTETMAEVLMQQGKVEKAINVYQKLSLLNPVKSAYFAAKIEQISR